ncbi:MAG: ATP-binding protein [Chromatiales bacterium]
MTQSKIADIEEAVQQKGIAIVEYIASDLTSVIFTRNQSELHARVQTYFAGYSDLVEITVTSADSEFVGQYSQQQRQHNGSMTLSFKAPVALGISSEPLDDFSQEEQSVAEPRNTIGYVSVTIIDSTQEQKYTLIKTNLLILLVSLAIIAMVVFPMSEKLTQPIRTLSAAFDKVRQGNFTQVAEASSDEMLKLQQGFNLMSSSLSRQNEKLNEKVAQVTNDLETTLQALEIQNIELDIARKQAVESSKIKSEFLANMSHEIRTPMNGIVGFSNLLLNTQLNEVQMDYAQTISRSANILLQILNDILDFSKLETGKITIHQYPFSLDDCVDEVLTIFTPSAHEKCLSLIPLVYQDVPRHLIGDKLRLIQILSNLVNNAIKFTASGEVVVRVMYDELDADHCSLTFKVSDTGIGISDADQRKLFGPFQQISNSLSRGFSGTGLGLSICKSMVEIMGGRISVSSALGQGATFSFTLPFRIDPSIRSEPLVGKTIKNKSIQLVDTNRLSSLSIVNTLERMGFSVTALGSFTDVDLKASGENCIIFSLDCDQEDIFAGYLQSVEIPANYNRLALLNVSDRQALFEFSNKYHIKVASKPVTPRSLEQVMEGLNSSKDQDAAKEDPLYELVHELVDGKTILIVDDNEINQSLLEAMLSELDVTILTAGNGYQAIEIAQAAHVDLIFMDIHMPELDGIEATKAIRQLQGAELHTPIVALTADIAFRDKPMSQRYGFDDVLLKPIEPEGLNQTLLRFFSTEDHPADLWSATEYQQNELVGDSPDYPIRDEQHALRISGGVRAVADKLFIQLIEQLPSYAKQTRIYYDNKDWSALWQVVHKLHGASAVCSVPALHQAANALQMVVKNNDQTLIAEKLENLHEEIDRLLDYSRKRRKLV